MLAALAMTVVAAAAAAQGPSPLAAPERTIVEHVDAHNGEALALLERAVNINSGTQNFAGVREVGKLFAAELEALGFTTRWIDGAAVQPRRAPRRRASGDRQARAAHRPPRYRLRAATAPFSDSSASTSGVPGAPASST